MEKLNFKPEIFIFVSGQYGILLYNLSDYNNPVKDSEYREKYYGQIFGVDVSKDDKTNATVMKYLQLVIFNIEDLNHPYFLKCIEEQLHCLLQVIKKT